MSQVWKSKNSYLFQQPVDPKKLKIEDYFEVIKKPMDFSTIKNKINTNVYRNCQDFMDDMDLVFNNCYLYNGTESEIGKQCTSVK